MIDKKALDEAAAMHSDVDEMEPGTEPAYSEAA